VFKQPTVLIVGAGASVEFGYPLGPKLLENITKGISVAQKIAANPHAFPKIATDQDFLLYQYAVAYENAQSLVIEASWKDFDDFEKVAKSQTNQSVDRFLRDHPEFAKIGKYFIAQEVVTKSYVNCKPQSFAQGVDTKWIGALINELREGADDARELAQNKLTIITFNYDVVIEMALDAQLSNTSRHRNASWRDWLDVIHVYGEVRPPRTLFARDTYLEDLKASAKTISTIQKASSDTEFSKHVQKMRKKIQNSQKIISIGFSFDPANVDLLGLSDGSVGRKIVALNFDGHFGVSKALEKLGTPKENIFVRPTAGSEMTIADAISYGLLSTEEEHSPNLKFV
jgi:hypothetical protein